MSTKTIFFCLLFFTGYSSFSQRGLIQVTTENNPDKSVIFTAINNALADYTVRISFTNLIGYTSNSMNSPNIALATVRPGKSEILKLTRDNSMNPSLPFRSQGFAGHSFTKMPDTSFQYLIPASAGNHIKVTSNSSTVSVLAQRLETGARGTNFFYKLYDTICAARAGTVYEKSDTAQTGDKAEVWLKSGRNFINIEHRDGTLGHYGITAPIKLLVNPGDEVFPGQPLAVFTKESPGYLVWFSVTYLDEKKLISDNNPENAHYFNYVITHFYANENETSTILQINKNYTVQHPKDIISAEMTRKEKKKFGF
jgi:hypothetical protein